MQTSSTCNLIIPGKGPSKSDIDFGLLNPSVLAGGTMVVVTDSTVWVLEKTQKLVGSLVGLGKLDPKNIIVMQAGEANKNLDTYGEMLKKLTRNNIPRNAHIVALGGGVVGDMTGYLAATYNRGVQTLTQIPTTQLAAADSSVGGKTGIDVDGVKNAAGAFRQPNYVHIDSEWLKTLHIIEFKSGLAETIKHGVLGDYQFFEFLEKNIDKILEQDADVLNQMNAGNVKIKGGVVMEDPEEKARRKTLNYGHTLGHAFESVCLESGKTLPHGYCVAIGMQAAALLAIHTGTGFTETDLARQNSLLQKCGLPTTIPSDINVDEMIAFMLKDKKNRGGKIHFTLPKCIGEMAQNGTDWSFPIEESIIREVIKMMQSNQSWAEMFPDVQAKNERNTTSSVVTGVLNNTGKKARNTIWKETIDSLFHTVMYSLLLVVLNESQKQLLLAIARSFKAGEIPAWTPKEGEGYDKHRWRIKAANLLNNTEILKQLGISRDDTYYIGQDVILRGNNTIMPGAYVGARSLIADNITIGTAWVIPSESVVKSNLPNIENPEDTNIQGVFQSS